MSAVLEQQEGGGVVLTINFDCPPVVRDFIEDPTFVTGYFGPLGTAKTTAGTIKAFAYAQDWPGSRGVVIRSTWPALRDTTQKTFLEWLPDGAAGHYEKTPKTFWLRTQDKPAEIMFRAMDDQADIQDVLSMDIAWAWLDEPQGGIQPRRDGTVVVEPGVNHELWKHIVGRCGRQKGYRGMMWMTGNPPSPSHWITREFQYTPGESACSPPTNPREDFRLYLGDRQTNLANLPARYYERLMEIYGVGTPMARRYIEGLWIDFGTEQPFHAEWIRYWGTDEEPLPALGDLTIEAGYDAAISKKDTASKSALVIAGQLRKSQQLGSRFVARGRVYMLHAEAGHWSVYEQVDRILKAVMRWKVRTIRMQKPAFEQGLGQVLDHEARKRGIIIHVDLVPYEGDKIRLANAWSPLVENATVLFGTNQPALVGAMLAVPADPLMWDLVDAAGICVRGFPILQGDSQTIPGMEPTTSTRAAGYATRVERAGPPPKPHRARLPLPRQPGMRRAAGYSVRIRRPGHTPAKQMALAGR